MGNIGLVAPDMYTLESARALVGKQPVPIALAVGSSEKGVAEAAKLIQQGVDIVISRGETGKSIAAAFPDITVVFIKRSGLDIARALGSARQHKEPLAAVTFPDTLARIVAVCNALDIPVRPYPLENRLEAEAVVLRAVQEGAARIIVTAATLAPAQRLGIPYGPVLSSEESLLEAMEEARIIFHVRQMEKAKMSLLYTVLNTTDNGIMAVDAAGIVTMFNAVAERHTARDARDVIGRPASLVLPEFDLDQAIRSGESEPNALVRVRGETLVCNIDLVRVDTVVSGVVCTFQDANTIQAMEATVRRHIHASGHVATVHFQDIQGHGRAIRESVVTAREYARSDATVFLAGETGTGKELFAQSIHNHSARNRGPFVAVNCAALPGHLLESELFGYVAGAFTGASNKGKAGLFELAHGGTIFLDEVTEIEPGIQAKLLRVLQEKKVMRLGSDQVNPINVRVIASTNKDLKKLASSNDFRQDLYYRLNVLLLHLPPLRARKEDIPLLCAFFLKNFPQAERLPIFTPDAFAVLKAYSWPGNIRELQNVMVRLAATAQGKTVNGKTIRALLDWDGKKEKESVLVHDQAEVILQALRETRGRRGEAAQMLGMSRSTLWRKMRAL
ncbi:MAG: sigma 54-interacting transcriptional regulator [Zoogloeaceae bacterium]|nr:sigma 54-interacting transcriptional regulator [Zoogloeaceae bacterium]